MQRLADSKDPFSDQAAVLIASLMQMVDARVVTFLYRNTRIFYTGTIVVNYCSRNCFISNSFPPGQLRSPFWVCFASADDLLNESFPGRGGARLSPRRPKLKFERLGRGGLPARRPRL